MDTKQTEAGVTRAERTSTATEQQADRTGEAVPYPTGLSEDGASPILFDVHKRELGRRTFQTEFTEVNLEEDENKQRRSYAVKPGLALGNWVYDRGGPVTMARTNDGGFWREDLGGEFTYGEGRHGYSTDVITWSNWLTPVLSRGSWQEPKVVQARDPTLWELKTTSYEESGEVPGYWHGDLLGLSATMRVDHRGIIHQMQSEFQGSQSGAGEFKIRFTYEVSSIDSVSPSEPNWLTTAKDRRPTVSAALTSDRNYVRFTLESGNALEPDTIFTVYDVDNRWNAINYALRDPIKTGETVFLFKEESGPFHGQIARGSRPDNADPVSLEKEYSIWADRSVTYFQPVRL